ncbi:MAG: copper chaperone PCu(A)C [Spongiibacteraceae bacterium]
MTLSSSSLALEVSDAYVRGLPPTQKNTAAFFELYNPTNQQVTVTAGSSDAASRLEIHRHVHRQGMMAMELQPEVIIGPNERFVFAPGGHHLMLINLKRPLRDGDSVSFSLSLSTGELLEVIAPVVSVLRENSVNKHGYGSHK